MSLTRGRSIVFRARWRDVTAYLAVTIIFLVCYAGQDILVIPAHAQSAFCSYSPGSYAFDSTGGTQTGCVTGQGPNPCLPTFVSSTPPSMDIARFTGPPNTGQCSNSQGVITVSVGPATSCNTVVATYSGGNPGTLTVTQTPPASCGGGRGGGGGGAAQSLISVTFNIPNSFNGVTGPPLMSGPEPSATAANPRFGVANAWNNLPITFGVLTTNPSWSGLVDSKGAATNVNFSITGTVLPVNLYPYNPAEFAGHDFRSQYLAWNSNNGHNPGGAGPGESTTIYWTLTGLRPRTRYRMFVYGPIAGISRSFDMIIEGRTRNVPTYVSASTIGFGGAYFANIRSDGSGRISGLARGIGSSTASGAVNEANWTGFQLLEARRR